ncbi:MAG TPA: hypothetical protein VNM14_13930 [Planctomycetota bacterium]|jgi:hypothetical protein|nr:hypothetical protein [Planctomycetota bacterium]
MVRAALLAFLVPLAAGCSTSSIKEKLIPKASVLGVTVVELNPQQLTLKVNVKTDDVDLMLGMVKMKYKITLLDSELGQQNDHVPTTELMNLDDSGFAFLVKIPLDKPRTEPVKLGYVLQGAIVFKVIAKIADVRFAHQGELALNP